MNQYVSLLELICSSSPIPTAEVLQDVSALYARLGEYIQIAALLCLRVSRLIATHLSAARCRHAQRRLFAVFVRYVLHIFFNGKHLLVLMFVVNVRRPNDEVFLLSAAVKCKIPMSSEQQDSSPELNLDQGYCSTLKGEFLCFLTFYFTALLDYHKATFLSIMAPHSHPPSPPRAPFGWCCTDYGGPS